MKRKLSFIQKIWIFKAECGIIETCEICGSTNIRVKINHSGKNDEGYYCATYECLNCKAECVVEEKWFKK